MGAHQLHLGQPSTPAPGTPSSRSRSVRRAVRRPAHVPPARRPRGGPAGSRAARHPLTKRVGTLRHARTPRRVRRGPGRAVAGSKHERDRRRPTPPVERTPPPANADGRDGGAPRRRGPAGATGNYARPPCIVSGLTPSVCRQGRTNARRLRSGQRVVGRRCQAPGQDQRGVAQPRRRHPLRRHPQLHLHEPQAGPAHPPAPQGPLHPTGAWLPSPTT